MDANAVRRLFLWVLDQKGLTPEEAEKPTGLSRQTIRNHMKDDPPKLVGKTLRQMRAGDNILDTPPGGHLDWG